MVVAFCAVMLRVRQLRDPCEGQTITGAYLATYVGMTLAQIKPSQLQHQLAATDRVVPDKVAQGERQRVASNIPWCRKGSFLCSALCSCRSAPVHLPDGHHRRAALACCFRQRCTVVLGFLTSTASIRHDERQRYTNVIFWGNWGLGHVGGGASCRVWSPKFRSRICRISDTGRPQPTHC